MTRRIGILGGTFDPVHCGHLDVGASAEEALELTRMYVITSNVRPHRPQPFASAYHRFAMVSFAVSTRPDWRAADLELRSPTPSFTSGTLAKFHERGYAASELFFVIGADAFADIGAWRDYPAILDAAHFAVVSRPGFPVEQVPHRLPRLLSRMAHPPLDPMSQIGPMSLLIDAPTAEVSPTASRSRGAAGEPIAGLERPAG